MRSAFSGFVSTVVSRARHVGRSDDLVRPGRPIAGRVDNVPRCLDPAWLDELSELLRIPSVSADPAHGEDVRRAAEWVRDFVRGAGGECELVERNDRPLVVGELRASRDPDATPTVLVYGHFDVQPPDAARPVGEPAVRADDPRRVAVLPRRRRRQGPALPPAEGGGAARRGGRAARERSRRLRRGGGGRGPLDRRLDRRGRARRGRLRDLRRAHAQARPARVLRRDARGLLLPRQGADRRARPPLGDVRRRGAERDARADAGAVRRAAEGRAPAGASARRGLVPPTRGGARATGRRSRRAPRSSPPRAPGRRTTVPRRSSTSARGASRRWT